MAPGLPFALPGGLPCYVHVGKRVMKEHVLVRRKCSVYYNIQIFDWPEKKQKVFVFKERKKERKKERIE